VNYTQLCGAKGVAGSVATWMNNSTIVADVPEMVLEAESWIYRRLRHYLMLTTPVSGTLVSGQDFITSPSDMLEPYMFWLTQQYQQILPQRTIQDVIASWDWTASGTTYTRVQQTPTMFYFDQSTIRFDSVCDQAYTYNIIYFQQPVPLATSGSNFLTNTYPRLMRCAVMAAACEWTKESGAGQIDRNYWDQLAQIEVEQAQLESDRSKRGTEAGAIIVGGGIAGNWPGYTTGY
jgi:hypothetical protein